MQARLNSMFSSLSRSAWHITTNQMKVAFPAFFLVAGMGLFLDHALVKAVGMGLVVPVVLGGISGAIAVRDARRRHRVRTFTATNLQMSMFAAVWGAAWCIPFVLAIALQNFTLQPYWENAIVPAVWGAVCFLLGALPVGRA